MVLITIVTGAYKLTYNWGASHCKKNMSPTGHKLVSGQSTSILVLVLLISHFYRLTRYVFAFFTVGWFASNIGI